MMRKFHQKFQNIDILLMDDIQFIESKMKTMEDFFSTFEALYTNNKQIVIASDRLPGDIPKLDNRLRTRFEMGLVVDIKPPAYETRVEIVKSYASELGVDAEDRVYDYIAENFSNNVRELKGAFNKVCAYAEFMSTGLTLDTAQKALNCDMKKKKLTIDMIANSVAAYFDVSVKEMKSSARNQKVSRARQMAIYIARDVLGMSYESIGDYFEKKHTTVMYAFDQISAKLKTDDSVQNTVDEIKSRLKD
jgi:chromosomal replication initiator protein